MLERTNRSRPAAEDYRRALEIDPDLLPVRLRVPASGEVRSVQLGGPEPLPAALSGCLREKLLLWRFDDLHLSSDVDVFATFALR